MLTLERRVACKQCGTKNASGAERCQTCTRPLSGPINPIEQAYADRLWADPITTTTVSRRPVAALLVLAVIAGAVGANYFVWGYGPDWTHRIEADPAGSSWKSFRGESDYQMLLPGNPIVVTKPTAVGQVTYAVVGVDGHWDAVRDADTLSPDAELVARRSTTATIVVAEVADGTDPAGIAAGALNDAFDGSTIAAVSTTPGQSVPDETRTNVTATAPDYPDSESDGSVSAVVVQRGRRAFVIATFTGPTRDPALLDHLVDNFHAT